MSADTRSRTGGRLAALAPDPATLRLGLILGGLVLALLAGYALGRLGTSTGTRASAPSAGATGTNSTAVDPPGTAPHVHPGTAQAATGPGTGAEVGGVSLSAGGYTLVPESTAVPVGGRWNFRFHVLGADRKPVTNYAVVNDKRMHLIVARRDLSGYQHLHPSMAADGTWSVPLTLATAGSWRAYADFSAIDGAGQQVAVTLGVDLVSAGDYVPRALPPVARTAMIDGLTVTYQGAPQVGAVQPLLFRVFRDGSPVSDLQPYLGAYGHLVALREGDLGYLHVHPEPQVVDGAVKFWLTAPSPGRYRFFFDFQVAGTVRTAEFTVVLP